MRFDPAIPSSEPSRWRDRLRDLVSDARRLFGHRPVQEVAFEPVAMSAVDLLMNFESLGDNCEFGLVQRYCGAEPLGLFRFSFTGLVNLRTALGKRLADYGDDADLDIDINPGDLEFVCRSRRYGDFTCHTETFANKTTIEKTRSRELKKLAYLKDRLLTDLASGEKIFVRKCNTVDPLKEVAALHAVLRTFGPNRLLSVLVADAEHRPGHIEVVSDSLLRGYVSRFAPYETAHHIDIESWLELCRQAYRITCALNGMTTRLPCFPLNRIFAEGYDWLPASTCLSKTSTAVPRLYSDCAVTRLTMVVDEIQDAWLVVKPIDGSFEARSSLVFSAWIWIPATFKGTSIIVLMADRAAHFIGVADLACRDTWQRVWSSSKVTEDTSSVTGLIRATGSEGDTLYCTAWRLESGSVPNAPSAPFDCHEDVVRRPGF